MPQSSISYVVFNAYWDSFIGNTIDQSDQPLPPRLSPEKHFTYLVNSLRTLQETASLDRFSITLWLVELDSKGLSAGELRSRVAKAVPNLRFDICTLGRPMIERHILQALSIPLDRYRSPNVLHEFVLLFILKQTAEDRLLIVDCDVLFTRKDAPDDLLDLLGRHPNKLAASFVERPSLRPFLQRQQLSRVRMHTMTLVFDLARLKKLFDIEPLMQNLDFAAQVDRIPNHEAQRYYRQCRVYDTFSFFTEHLRHKYKEDCLLDLNDAIGGFHEGSKLTILSNVLIHAKYLEPDGYESLCRALKERPLEGEMVEYALDMVRSSRKQPSDW
jgi:hypothetical protein